MKEHSDSPLALLHNVEVCLVARSRVRTLEVGCELAAQLLLEGESLLEQVHEP
jgi:anthranilate phosphoribosyltransferase